jgi:hypothetical protein
MKEKLLLLAGAVFVCAFGFSQELKPTIIAAGGGSDKTTNISLDWTLGEFAVETISFGGKMYTQGFHQPILVVKSYHSPPANELITGLTGYKVFVAPNPAQSFFNVVIEDESGNNLLVTLYDLNGKKLQTKQGSGPKYTVRMNISPYASGVYLLDIRSRTGKQIGIYKIVKAD